LAPQQRTSEEQEIISVVERFVAERVRPRVLALEAAEAYPESLVEEMKELGLFGIGVPEQYGGLGLRLPVLAAVFEALSNGWTTLAAYLNSHSTVCYALASFGTEAQKAAYLPQLAIGEARGSLCLTEPHAGSDLKAIKASARDAGDHYELNASKVYVTNGGRATLLLTLAKHPESGAHSLLLVDKTLPGVSVTSTFHKTAFGLVDTVQIDMEGALVAKDRLLGAVAGRGFSQLMDSLEVGRVAIAISAVGLAANALSEAMSYAAVRKTFGVTIDQHQAVQLKLANMATKLAAARLVAMDAARLKEAGGRCDMITAMAKTFASEAAAEIAHDAVVIHGGGGYIRGCAVERLNREALLYVIGEGTNDINRLVVARRMNGPDEMDYLGVNR
jgi:isovaleryl-CoA dehydrogenase